jgi:hypothetical protein
MAMLTAKNEPRWVENLFRAKKSTSLSCDTNPSTGNLKLTHAEGARCSNRVNNSRKPAH